MSHTGRKRRAAPTCENCTRRRIKCDAREPHCRKCEAKGIECKGVLNPLDLVFRDESKNIQARIEQRANLPRLSTAAPRASNAVSSNSTRSPSTTTTGAGSSADASVNAAPSSAVQLRRPSPWSQSPLQTPIHEFATQLFLQCRPQIMRRTGLIDPFYDFIPTSFAARSRCSDQDALSTALQAFSLAAWGQSEHREDLSVLAVQKYGKTIKTLKSALAEPSENLSDDSLMAVKLLMGYELLISAEPYAAGWGNHVKGQLAIAKCLNPREFRAPEQFHMYYAALLDNGLTNAFTSTKFDMSREMVIEKLQGQSGPQVDHVMFMLDVVELRYQSSITYKRAEDSASCMASVDRLFEIAVIQLAGLGQWRERLHRARPYEIFDARYPMPQEVEQAEIWSGPLHVYQDLRTAHDWNLLRTWQLYTITVILRALFWKEERVVEDEKPELKQSLAFYCAELQSIVDEVCADVPYYLGVHHDTPPEIEHIDLSRLDGRGGLSLWVWLVQCFSIEALPEKQNRWLRARMRYIGEEVHYKWALYLADNAHQNLIFDRVDNAPDMPHHLTPGFLASAVAASGTSHG